MEMETIDEAGDEDEDENENGDGDADRDRDKDGNVSFCSAKSIALFTQFDSSGGVASRGQENLK